MSPKEIEDMPKALRLLADQITAPDDVPAMCLRDAAAMVEALAQEVFILKAVNTALDRYAQDREEMEKALVLAAQWGVSSKGYSAQVAGALSRWIDGGMEGPAPEAPAYYGGKS